MPWWPGSGCGCGGAGHALFRWESLLSTLLFVGFPGFVSFRNCGWPTTSTASTGAYMCGMARRGPGTARVACGGCWPWCRYRGRSATGSCPGSRPADALSDASATVPEQLTMWLPMVPRSKCAARRQQTWPHQGSGRVGIMRVICQVGDFRGDWPSAARRWPMRASGSRAAMCCVLRGGRYAWPASCAGAMRAPARRGQRAERARRPAAPAGAPARPRSPRGKRTPRSAG